MRLNHLKALKEGKIMNDKMPIVTLKSGLRVGNFSSPHSFTFVTGEVLPACSPERAKALMLEALEVATRREHGLDVRYHGGWVDIALTFRMSDVVLDALRAVQPLIELGAVDVLIVPLPVKRAMDEWLAERARNDEALDILVEVQHHARTCRVADRVTKTIYGDRFCL